MMFQKTYMSRAVTRAMAIDHPIGDPTGGVAFGERNEPISAAISIASMIGTYSAATAAATGWTLMQGIAFAGAAVSLVGNITGNETLMQFGAVAGIVGGLGMSGLLGETLKNSSLTGTSLAASPAAATTAGTAAATPSTYFASPTPSAVELGGAPVGITSPLYSPSVSNVPSGPFTQPINVAPSAAEAIVSPRSISDIISTSPVAKSALGDAVAPVTNVAEGGATTAYSSIVPADQLGNQGGAFGVNIEPTGIAGNNPPAVGPQSMYEKALGYGKETLDFARTNPTAAMMAGKAVGAVGDWLTGKTDAELEALKAQSSLYGARGEQIRYEIALEKQKRANINAGYANVNAGIRVNPNAGISQPWNQQSGGLINTARKPD